MEPDGHRCNDDQCVCNGSGTLVWVVDLTRWTHQLLCNQGGLIFLEVEGDLEVYDYVGDAPGYKGNPARDSPPLPTPDDFLRCANCNRLVLPTGQNQKYCIDCSKVIHRARKKEWIREHRKRVSTSNHPFTSIEPKNS